MIEIFKNENSIIKKSDMDFFPYLSKLFRKKLFLVNIYVFIFIEGNLISKVICIIV